ncbi:MAG TPA: cysteine desulfurase family protein [Candidatus Pacearchaeota archaeon]|nr:cysteine desulfurase [Candidatus Parcubacteria bacterium]HOU45944.1 cysteine desulfurase family protein [Candidatus Pacearchaeota archaeon]HQI74657.1 cysteine desulfurase family protein [Candidatus Pacearchaeota archaeon]
MKTIKNKQRIYLDYAATTPVDPRVIKTMLPYFNEYFGNPASMHYLGRKSFDILEKARLEISKAINALPQEIYFTGSATESNNWALKGIVESFIKSGKKQIHIIVSSIEHDCVLNTAKYLENKGIGVIYLESDSKGFINLDQLKKSITADTVLVSIIHGNNEIGTVQDLKAISEICHSKGVLFHTDAAQSFTKIPIDVRKMGIDMLTASAHKIYGFKGAAFLYLRQGIKIEPLLHGGGQEKGMRSSTVNMPAIIGFAKATEIGIKNMAKESAKLSKMRDWTIKKIIKEIPKSFLNGDSIKRLPNNINMGFLGIEGESLLMELDQRGIAVSTGSACSSPKLEPSHVLQSCGLSYEKMHGSIRISIGRWTTKQQLEYFVEELKKSVEKLRKISPLK